jgi:hypothetical protein
MVVKDKNGTKLVAVQPRLLPAPPAMATSLQANDRLDIIAFRQYQDGTKYWHIADANTQIEARLLTEPENVNSPTPPVNAIQVPQK